MRLISKRTHERLQEMNAIRNKCSHYWLLDVAVRRRTPRTHTKRRLVQYMNKDLFEVPVMKEFMAEYGQIYYRLWLKMYA
jgi:hypothetical protein